MWVAVQPELEHERILKLKNVYCQGPLLNVALEGVKIKEYFMMMIISIKQLTNLLF